ncbi:hypothetical protein BGX23_002181 [Mortierella sp. AD031]|nr:hypothetical protein BGX23_002181 [Mortierella sp. AD031]
MRWFRKAADQGYADASFGIGSLYRQGHGVFSDFSEAQTWYLKAIKDDPYNKYAPFHTALLYRDGDCWGRIRDTLRAQEWFLKAARLGNSDAQEMMGVICRDDDDDDDSVDGAEHFPTYLQYLFEATDRGDNLSGTAQLAIGMTYNKGKDSLRAMEWFIKAAVGGSAGGLYYIGKMYFEGRKDVPRDHGKAKEWFGRAAEKGHTEALKRFYGLNGTTMPPQV